MPVTVTSMGTITPFDPASTYRKMKDKWKVAHDDDMYANYIRNAISVMFAYDEKIYRPDLFDLILRDCGMAALIKTNTSPYTPVFFYPVGGERYSDGWFRDAKCYDLTGKDYTFKDWLNNKDIIVVFNTPNRTPDTFIEKFANMLTDVDVSIINNVHYSRQHPIPIVRDKRTKNMVDESIRSIDTGSTKTILVDTNLQDLLNDGKMIDVLNLTEVEKSQYIQYLSHLHDSLISRLFFMIGLGTTDNGKQAQITTEELNKNDDASITQALAWYEARKKGFDDAREKGHDLSFDFHPVWKMRIDRIVNPPEQKEEVDENLTEERGEENAETDSAGDSDN